MPVKHHLFPSHDGATASWDRRCGQPLVILIDLRVGLLLAGHHSFGRTESEGLRAWWLTHIEGMVQTFEVSFALRSGTAA